MDDTTSIFDITLHYLAPAGAVMLLGLLGGKLAKRVRLPKVTGYLLMGIIIGPSMFNLISTEIVENLSLINDIALGLIMFAIGGVFEIHHIRSVGKKTLWLTVGQSLGAALFTTVALVIVGLDWFPAVLLGTIGIATAPAATLLVIREFEAKGDFTDTLITIVATSNIVCILGFELVFSLGEIRAGTNPLYALLSPLYELGGSLVIGFCVGYIISKWEQHVEDQAELLMIIVAGVMLVIGLALTLNLQPLFAALIMGAVTTNLSLMHRLVYIELRQVEQPLYIAFFVLAGASLHLELLPALGLAGVVYLISRVFGKIIGIYTISRWRKLSANVKRYLGLGMVVQAGVAIGLIDIVNSTDPELGNIISPIILATVIIYETAGPPIIRFILFKAGEAVSDLD
ncbi:MAG: cation:proton antiporter [Candidatus Zixiibacteriota bacterium]|nr:MAG: cation:proton antiporter [candidate division Zixibacteria bacterium]